jgi:hypothetical protein
LPKPETNRLSQSGRKEAAALFTMPKLTGPCLSTEARGTLARLLTFLKTRRGTVVKKRTPPHDPATFLQLYRRWMFAFLQRNWAALEAIDKQTWNDLADFHNVSPNNAYLGTNMERWDNFEVPSAYLPIQQTGSPGTVALFTTTKDNNRIKVTLKVTPISQNWGMILYFSHGLPPSHIPQHVIQVNLHVLSTNQYYYYYPTSGGYHWFKISLFSYNGERYDHPTARFVNMT